MWLFSFFTANTIDFDIKFSLLSTVYLSLSAADRSTGGFIKTHPLARASMLLASPFLLGLGGGQQSALNWRWSKALLYFLWRP